MKSPNPYPEVRGTPTGYVLRYTCPACLAESIIVNRSFMDRFENTRVVTCRQCRTRIAVLTPDQGA